jgi:hypothetical protein
MKAIITKITKNPSKFSGDFYYIFFKDCETGKGYRMPVAPEYRNFKKWKAFVENPERARGTICDGLVLKSGDVLDADFLSQSYLPKEVQDEFEITKECAQ